MVNALGVFGWGVGGIEAEAAMLGQPSSMLIPEVVGFRLHGRLSDGATATDLVLTVTEMLRKKGVVGKFVEFYGSGLSTLSVPDRATIANMSPEYGATMGFFPVDAETLAYLQFTGRSAEQIALVEAYCKSRCSFAPIRRLPHSSTTPWSWTWEPSSPLSLAPSVRRIASRYARPRLRLLKSSTERQPSTLPSETTATRLTFRAAPGSLPPSPAAPTHRTPRLCWALACWRRKLSSAVCTSSLGSRPALRPVRKS